MELKGADGTTATMPVTAEFKQDGKSVTGTAGREGDEQLALQKGTIEDTKFTFEISAPDGTYDVTLTVVSDSQLEGGVEHTDADGNKQNAKISFARAK